MGAQMESAERVRVEVLREVHELLDTAAFSLETVRMALGIGQCARDPLGSLDSRLASPDEEEREAGVVALEALEHARSAYLELASLFDQPDNEILGYEIRFWTSFDWAVGRLFDPSVRTTGHQSLRSELVEATSRTSALATWLDLIGQRELVSTA